jgi:small subunit ribosomal protein S8
MDPISDMLTAIKNAQAVKKETVEVPFSNLKFEIAKILEKNGFVEKVGKKGVKKKKVIEIKLKYENGLPAISGLKRISKPGQRIYLPVKKIRKVKGGYGIAIISTSKGVMTDKEARKLKVGGEILCEVW